MYRKTGIASCCRYRYHEKQDTERILHFSEEKKETGSFAHVSTMRNILQMKFVMLKDRKKWKYEITGLTEDKTSRLEED